MYHATSRLSVFKFAAATSISLAAIATGLPSVIGSVSDLAGASVQPDSLAAAGGRGTILDVPALAPTPIPVAHARRQRESREGIYTTFHVAPIPAAHPRPRSYANVADLPPAGTLVSFELTAPPDPSAPALGFTAQQTPAALVNGVIFSTFALPPPPRPVARTILARLPQARPERVFSVGPDGTVEADTALLAYAEAPSDIEAPFDAVMSKPSDAVPAEDQADSDLYVPRPRPDPDDVLGWLDGRALGQFAPGQHDWVRNPLPASVFDAKQQQCLAQGIYFEARSESDEGQAAVAQVILNRVRNPAYPKTICGVVYQNEAWRHHCQFSFACDGRSERIEEQAAWKKAEDIALDVTNGKTWIDEVGDSTHYHAEYVHPGWGRRMIQVDRLGEHVFYRTKDGGWS